MVQLPFLKKKTMDVLPGKGFVPNDRVREMASRGFSEPEMIDVLRKEGFSPDEIDKSLTSTLQSNIAGEPQAQQPAQQNPGQKFFPTSGQDIFPSLTPTFQQTGPQDAPKQEPTLPQVPETSLPETYSTYSTEDYIDYALQSRLGEVYDMVDDMQKQNNEFSSKLSQLQQKMETFFSAGGSSSTDARRIESFTENISQIESRVSSLERAFKETLPSIIESVRTLSDLIKK